MGARLLFVDDDELLLMTMARLFRDRCEVETARSGREALEIIRHAPPFAVIVADQRMPGMDGVELLQEVKALSPDTTRVMLTADTDQLSAIEAVNAGNVFRFLVKPIDRAALLAAVEAACRQYDLVSGTRVLLEQTLSGSVQVLVDLLSMFDPKVFGQAERTRDLALKLAARMGLASPWDLGLAALLAPVGRMALPFSIQSKMNWGDHLTRSEEDLCQRVPETTARIIGNIPRLQPVARIIRYSAKNFDGRGIPDDGVAGEDIPLESRILRVAADYFENRKASRSNEWVLGKLRAAAGAHDPRVLAALTEVLATPGDFGAPKGIARVALQDLGTGMCLREDVCTPEGALILPAGTLLTPIHLERLRSVASITRLVEQVVVEAQ